MGIKSMKILHLESKSKTVNFMMQWMWVMKVNYECVLGICKMKGCIWIFWRRHNFWRHLTNRYDMPSAPFVGLNHHSQSMLLGCALLSNEDTKTFTWLFTTCLKCMHGRASNAIITYQDIAMKNEIDTDFPIIAECSFSLLCICSNNSNDSFVPQL